MVFLKDLDNEVDEGICDEIWIAEANRRYQEIKTGKAKGIPASEVFDEARLRLQS